MPDKSFNQVAAAALPALVAGRALLVSHRTHLGFAAAGFAAGLLVGAVVARRPLSGCHCAKGPATKVDAPVAVPGDATHADQEA